MPLALALGVAAASPEARAEEVVTAVLAVGDAPAGPDRELARLAGALREECRARSSAVLEASALRSRLAGEPPAARLAELDRAAGAAVQAYLSGDYARSARAWRALVSDLESLPEGPEAYEQWTRAVLRLAHAEGTLGRWADARAAMERLLAVEPRFAPDPDDYAPSYRRVFDDARQKLRSRPSRRLAVTSSGRPGAVFVNGKSIGVTPVTVTLPAGRYRVGGTSGGLRAPTAAVDLRTADGRVELDFALSDAVRLDAGPGLALAPSGRPEALRELGARLGVDRVVALAAAAGDGPPALAASLHEVRSGAVLREARVRRPPGADAAPALRALARFLLTGERVEGLEVTAPAAAPAAGHSRAASDPALSAPLRAPAPEPVPLELPPASARAPSAGPVLVALPAASVAAAAAAAATVPPATLPATAPPPSTLPAALAPAPDPPTASDLRAAAPPPVPAAAPAARRSGWLRPAAWISGALALGMAGVASWQGLAAASAYDRANAMVRADGLLAAGADPARYHDALGEGDRARRMAWASAGSSVALAATAGVLGWLSAEPAPAGAR
ncbi:PEGA domain-containing protein [Anaeromyxobacter paludicola]|uniref:PEGA domain-containing protein n=1 Tax=Anaeromyxobacter paludicola TaxID=2918171 RepID=A0ABM7XDC8_9BACT|nr:PEGA domain-containing protein [Anaeromyxobacter paludicola]BDG09878.1 hypothetical protein AMPC_29910 [Anaeromyxobacter paludicola]